MISRAEALAFGWALQWFDPPEDEPPTADHEAFRWALIQRTLLDTPTDQGIVTHADGSTSENWARSPLFPPSEDDPAGYDYDDEKGAELIKQAESGDREADAALCRIAVQYMFFGREMPFNLRSYVVGILLRRFMTPPAPQRGGSPHGQHRRNLYIVGMVSRLVDMGIKPTRNRAARDGAESGCSAVAKALARVGIHIDETGVEKVWAKRSRYVRR
jgi:hypothetical protein